MQQGFCVGICTKNSQRLSRAMLYSTGQKVPTNLDQNKPEV